MSEHLREEINRLSLHERIQLVEEIWDGIAAENKELPLTDAQKAEIERRAAEHRSDPSSSLPWEEVRERLRMRVADRAA